MDNDGKQRKYKSGARKRTEKELREAASDPKQAKLQFARNKPQVWCSAGSPCFQD